MNTELFSLGDVAQKCGVKPYRVQYLISTGAVPEPALRVAGKRLWNHAEIAALLDTLEIQSAAKMERGRGANV